MPFFHVCVLKNKYFYYILRGKESNIIVRNYFFLWYKKTGGFAQ